MDRGDHQRPGCRDLAANERILHWERQARRFRFFVQRGFRLGPTIYDDPGEASRQMQLLGFIAPKGPPGYIDYVITEDRKGLQYADTEKSYTMIEGLNFIIANARRRIPEIKAVTEFAPYHWTIQIGKDGWAKQVPPAEPVAEDDGNDRDNQRRRTSPMRRYFEHLRRNWRRAHLNAPPRQFAAVCAELATRDEGSACRARY